MLEMCPKDIMDIRMPGRDNDNRLMGPPIIELKFEKYILDQQIIIGGENIQLLMKKERPTSCEGCLQFGHPKKYCRSDRELCTKCVEQQQEGRMHDCRGNFYLYCKEPHKTGDKNICGEYKMKATIQNRMRLDKCDAYTAKETLGYRWRKSYDSTARRAAKREEKKEGQKKKQIQRQITGVPNNKKKQNKENEEKDSETHRQEMEETTNREKVDEKAIKKRTHGKQQRAKTQKIVK